uniref:G_PROTEIN_RECEP_F1_2 domain-containing protein n=1 Tax=Meloidogyne hapla TaxID=6305 RepID=A0A1I8BGI8_MELHA
MHFFEVLHQSGHFVFFFITLTGINFIPASLAFKIEAHSIIAANIVNFMFLSMSIDRFIAIAFPLFYVQINFRFYIFLHLFSNFIFALVTLYIHLISVFSHPNFYVTSNIADIYGLPGPFDTRICTTIILSFAIFVHLIIGLLAKYKGGCNKNNTFKFLQKFFKKILQMRK